MRSPNWAKKTGDCPLKGLTCDSEFPPEWKNSSTWHANPVPFWESWHGSLLECVESVFGNSIAKVTDRRTPNTVFGRI